jgi:hypothetical protein
VLRAPLDHQTSLVEFERVHETSLQGAAMTVVPGATTTAGNRP